MAWIDTTTGETASTLKTRLEAAGARVNLSAEKPFVILSHDGANPLKETQTVETWEYRGLTEAAAKLLTKLSDDNTETVIYYAKRRTSNVLYQEQYLACATKSGTKLDIVAFRADESGKWVARATSVTYGASGTGWNNIRPEASETGIVVSQSSRTTAMEYGYDNTIVGYKQQTITTTVREYPFLTQEEKNTLCTSSDGTSLAEITYYDTEQTLHYFKYKVGTVVDAQARYIDEANGWIVTKTTEVYGA